MTSHVATVTGAAQGVGRAIAARLVRDGFVVAVADLNLRAAEATCAQLSQEGPGRAFAVPVDVTDEVRVEQMVAAVLQEAGQIDLLVNNAGIVGPVAPVANYTTEAWRQVLAVNLDGVFYCCRAVLPHMLARGRGRIVNIASISGKEGNPLMSAYSTSKAGVIGFTKALAKEVATSGILVNCVAPALLETEMAQQIEPTTRAQLIAKIPMGRLGLPAEVAALVAWLGSAECSFSTGAVFDISGGRATY